MRHRLIGFLAVAVVLSAADAYAQRDCRFVDGTPTSFAVSFDDYSVFSSASSQLRATVTVQVDCVPPSKSRVTLSASGNGMFVPRSMTNGSETLAYNAFLVQPAPLAGLVLGDGSAGTAYVETIGQPGNKIATIVLDFRTNMGADAIAGVFSDALTLQLREFDAPHAVITSLPITVTANVLKECQVSTFTLPFGNYDPIGAHATSPLTANTTVNVRCTRGVKGDVELSAGSNPIGNARQLAFGANRLQYNIFRDAGLTSIWNTDNRLDGLSTSKLTPLGGGLIGYGAIPPGQTTAPPGSYYDTLIATVTY